MHVLLLLMLGCPSFSLVMCLFILTRWAGGQGGGGTGVKGAVGRDRGGGGRGGGEWG